MQESGALDLRLVSKGFKGVAVAHWRVWQFAMVELRKDDPYTYIAWDELIEKMEALPDDVPDAGAI